MTDAERNLLVVVHARRDDTVAAAQRVVSALREAGARPVLSVEDRQELGDALAPVGPVATLGADVPVEDVELAIVLGGDGTILRAA
ncbi:MAG: NAD kinase, partial [Microbacterium sp.]|nr:NAD kinase [Microbacterium sp.]